MDHWLALVETNGCNLYLVPAEVLKNRKDEKKIVQAAARESVNALFYASARFRASWDCIGEIVMENGRAMKYVARNVRLRERMLMLAAVKKDWRAAKFLVQSRAEATLAAKTLGWALNDDKEIMRAAVLQNGEALKWAGTKVRSDESIVLAALETGWRLLEYAEDAAITKRVALTAVGKHWQALEFVKDWRDDYDVVFAAVTQNGRALMFASWMLKFDKTVQLQAVKTNGYALEYCESQDESIVLAAVQRDPEALRWCWRDLQSKTVALAAVRRSWTALEWCTYQNRGDPDILGAGLAQAGEAIQFSDLYGVPIRTRSEIELALQAVRKDWEAVKFLLIGQNREIAEAALEQEGLALQYFHGSTLTDDALLVRKAVAKNGLALQFASHRLRKDREIVQEAVRANYLAFKFADASLREEVSFVVEAMKADTWAFKYASQILRNNRKFLLAAVRANAAPALFHAAAKWRQDPCFVAEAISLDARALCFAEKTLWQNPELIVEAVKQKKFGQVFTREAAAVDDDDVTVSVSGKIRK